jgi:hypothetical protein
MGSGALRFDSGDFADAPGKLTRFAVFAFGFSTRFLVSVRADSPRWELLSLGRSSDFRVAKEITTGRE